MTLDDLLLLGEQMQRWQARIDNGEAGDWPHPETATFVRAALERIPALRAELAEWERLARDQHAALVSANKWPREGASQKCGWCVEAAGNDQAAWDAAPKYTLEEARAHATVCPHSPLVRELAEAHEALTASRAEVEQLRETANYYRNTLGIKSDSPTDIHVRPGAYGVSVERILHHKGCPARVTGNCVCLPLKTSDLITPKEPSDIASSRCARCHAAPPNANGCARCNPERLGERLTEANEANTRLRDELDTLRKEASRG